MEYSCLDCQRPVTKPGRRCKSCCQKALPEDQKLRKVLKLKQLAQERIGKPLSHIGGCTCNGCKAKRGELRGTNSHNFGKKHHKQNKLELS